MFISHDLRVVRALADEVMVLKDGKVVERGPRAQIFDAPREPYTGADGRRLRPRSHGRRRPPIMPAILFLGRDDPEGWIAEFKRAAPDLDVRLWDNRGDPAAIDVVLAWRHPKGAPKRYPNLKLIVALGAGYEHILGDPDRPAGVPVVRLVDDKLTQAMTEYVLLHVLRYHRQMPEFEAAQRERRWIKPVPPETDRRRVGILGLGALGRTRRAGSLISAFRSPPGAARRNRCRASRSSMVPHSSRRSPRAPTSWSACCRSTTKCAASSTRPCWRHCRAAPLSSIRRAAAMSSTAT